MVSNVNLSPLARSPPKVRDLFWWNRSNSFETGSG